MNFLFRIRKLSLNFLGPDEERPFINQPNESISNPTNPQLPSIVIEQPETINLSNDNDNEQRQRTTSTTSDHTDTTKL